MSERPLTLAKIINLTHKTITFATGKQGYTEQRVFRPSGKVAEVSDRIKREGMVDIIPLFSKTPRTKNLPEPDGSWFIVSLKVFKANPHRMDLLLPLGVDTDFMPEEDLNWGGVTWGQCHGFRCHF